MYACHPQKDLARVKIGFTTQPDPVFYCHNNYGRTLCPLAIAAIFPVGNARVAETIIHVALVADRTDPHHEVFDLSTVRNHKTGTQRLEEAIDVVRHLNEVSGLPIPVAVDNAALREEARRRREALRHQRQEALRISKQREVAARQEARVQKRKLHQLQQAETKRQRVRTKQDSRKPADHVAKWIENHLRCTENPEDFVKRSDMYRHYRSNVEEERDKKTALGKQKFFHKLMLELGEAGFRARYQGGNQQSRDVFLGYRSSFDNASP